MKHHGPSLLLMLMFTVGCADHDTDDPGGGDVADQADNRGSAFGKAQYTRITHPEVDIFGLLVINDEAAERMFADMTDAVVDPEIADMKERTPELVSLDDCEGRLGRHVICRKVPRFTEDGEALVFDDNGDLVYLHQCFIHLVDVTRGHVLDNDAAVEPQ